MHRSLTLAMCVGCGSVKMAPPPDAFPTTILVATTGDDSNDGLTSPVKTVKRAIGLAAADTSLSEIVIAVGRYDAANGESFPYTVPPEVTISGPAGGGTVLAGDGSAPALTIATGTLHDLELEDFSVAIVATDASQLSNLRIRSSGIAIRGETTAQLAIDHLDVTGTTGACATGVQLNGAADATIDTASTRTVERAFDLREQSTLAASNGMLTGDASCTDPSFDNASVRIATTGKVSFSATIIDGGLNGISCVRTTPPTPVTLTDVTVRNVAQDAMVGEATVAMTGGELSSNGRAGLEASDGNWSFTNVAMKSNQDFAIYLQIGQIAMRGSSIVGNHGDGIILLQTASADLGTPTSPGGNVFQSNSGVGIDIESSSGTGLVTAAGNTWVPNVQGADAQGHYPPGTVAGPVAVGSGNNFAVTSGWSLQH